MADLTYLLPVWDTISEAWRKVKGTKATVWAALAVLLLIIIGLQIVRYLFETAMPNAVGIWDFVSQVITFLLEISLLYIGIQRAQDLPISWRMMFRAFDWSLALKLILLYILQIIIFLPFVILFIIGVVILSMNGGVGSSTGATSLSILLFVLGVLGFIYLMIRMYLAWGFVIDRKVGPWQAVKLSFQATRSNFWRLFAIVILFMLILIVSAIPLFIGWIWTLPMGYILYGLVYKNLSFNVTSLPEPK